MKKIFVETQIKKLFRIIITKFYASSYEDANTRIIKHVILEPYMWIIYKIISYVSDKYFIENAFDLTNRIDNKLNCEVVGNVYECDVN